jgi:hypothetical protein
VISFSFHLAPALKVNSTHTAAHAHTTQSHTITSCRHGRAHAAQQHTKDRSDVMDFARQLPARSRSAQPPLQAGARAGSLSPSEFQRHPLWPACQDFSLHNALTATGLEGRGLPGRPGVGTLVNRRVDS